MNAVSSGLRAAEAGAAWNRRSPFFADAAAVDVGPHLRQRGGDLGKVGVVASLGGQFGDLAASAFETAAEPKKIVFLPGGHFAAYTGDGSPRLPARPAVGSFEHLSAG